MRIAIVSVHADPLRDDGGLDIHVGQSAAALVRQGCEVTVYTRRDRPDLEAATETPQGYAVVHIDAGPAEPVPKEGLMPYMGRFGERLGESWGIERPDVVHAHYWLSGLAALRAALPLEIPVVQSFHGLGAAERRHLGSADPNPRERVGIEREIAGTCGGVIAACEAEAADLAEIGVAADKVTVVPGGVDLNLFCPVGPAAGRDGWTRLLVPGNLMRRKGADAAILALQHLPGTELIIAGGPEHGQAEDDAEARRLRWVAEEAGVSERVLMPGRAAHDAMPALYRASDAVVCTSWYEPSGAAALEAMACGVPVVAAAVGCLKDLVVDGVTGRLLDEASAEAVAAAVEPYLSDPALAERAGLAGRARACGRYSWESVAAETVKALERAVA
ncbi:glycosyltransferase [Glycomyces sp. A-F 0318]|uniref:glycosyltransferase n=1 Tax=Glycomyces amatae TaxID=2881355 RepID=UPI001E315620|nr:glycosyltransferase [Glycomyces amatae]MCD0444730.1 glycosyltransferase [Glycomyces amatae]